MLDKSCSSKIVCNVYCWYFSKWPATVLPKNYFFLFFLADPSFRDFERGLKHKWNAKNSKSPQEGEAKAVP